MKLSKLLPSRFRKGEVTIPVVRLQGTIMAGGNAFNQYLNLTGVAGPLKRAFDMKAAPVVAISINSPGGSPAQSRLIYSRIRELSEEKNKTVLVFIEDVAASGGYMIALAGDEIIADETSIIGSIGVVAATFGFVETIKKLGVERRVYTAGKNKVTLDPFLPAKKADIFTGLFWTGRPAQKLGLIDGFGHMSSVLKERYGEKTEMVLMGAKRGWLGRPQPGVALSGNLHGIGTQIAQNLPDSIIDTANERALWARYGL